MGMSPLGLQEWRSRQKGRWREVQVLASRHNSLAAETAHLPSVHTTPIEKRRASMLSASEVNFLASQ